MTRTIIGRVCAAFLLSLGLVWTTAGIGQEGKSSAEKDPPASEAKAATDPADFPKADALKADAPKDDAPKADAPPADPSPKAADEKSGKDAPAKDAPAKEEGKQDAPETASADAAAAQYQAKLAEWKQLLKDLRELKGKYDAADKEQLDALRTEWEQMIAKGEALMPQLRDAAMKAYAASPNEDRQLLRLLAKMLEDDMGRDAYESALPLAKLLVDNEAGMKEAYQAVGVSSFATGDFETAERFLKEAEAEGGLSEEGRNFLKVLDDYKKYGAQEEELRKKEAEADDLPRVKLSTTKGDMVIELFENEAPETVGNFVSLVEKGFYDNKTFHRVLKGFMAQGGCPKGDGSGGPGYNIYCECYKPEYRKHFRGSLSMAHAGRDTGGSQFFITFVPTPHLNGKHTVFGRVIEGLQVLEHLQRIDPQGKEKVQPDKIVKAEVIRKRDHEYVPHKVQ